jgi:hypothetical protein
MILLVEGVRTTPDVLWEDEESRSILYTPEPVEEIRCDTIHLYRLTDLVSGNEVTMNGRELYLLIKENVLL